MLLDSIRNPLGSFSGLIRGPLRIHKRALRTHRRDRRRVDKPLDCSRDATTGALIWAARVSWDHNLQAIEEFAGPRWAKRT